MTNTGVSTESQTKSTQQGLCHQKAGSMPRLRQKESLSGIVRPAWGTLDPHIGGPAGIEGSGEQMLRAEGIAFLQSIHFLFNERCWEILSHH